MSADKKSFERERAAEDVVVVPTAEILQEPHHVAKIWPELCSADESFIKQIETHARRVQCMNEIIDCLPGPTMSIEHAIEAGFLNSDQAEHLYLTLSDILEDEELARLVLYLPFEWLPNASWVPENPALLDAIKLFADRYLIVWHNLLSVQDARANFVDGDILEPEYRTEDLPRVIKAAHLLPGLIERSILTETDARQLLGKSVDPILKQSISEGIAAYYGGNYLPLVTKKPMIIPTHQITEARQQWLQRKDQENYIVMAANQLACDIINGDTTYDLRESDIVASHVYAIGIYEAIERIAATDKEGATAIYEHFKDALATLWDCHDPQLDDRLASIYRRLYRLGVIDEPCLQRYSINLPQLGPPWSENLKLLNGATNKLKHVTQAIESHPELAKLIYPVILLGGSQLKGYGEQRSDIDTTIFVKSGTPEHMRERIRELVEGLIGEPERYELNEFWLEQDNDKNLKITDYEGTDKRISDSYSTHVLFGSVWIGNEGVIRHLQQNILRSYFDCTDKLAHQQLRQMHLQRMEQSAVLYRLLHHGYARHYPVLPRSESLQSELIDGGSVFWDSGYRQLATQLFINTVFLPKFKK